MHTSPSSTWIQDTSPIKNFKCYMQTERRGKNKSWKLNTKLDPVNAVATSSEGYTEVRGITFSGNDNNWLKLHARVSCNLYQAEATSKSHTYKTRSESPSHTHRTLTREDCEVLICKPEASFPRLGIHMLAENTETATCPSLFLLGHWKIFAHLYQWST